MWHVAGLMSVILVIFYHCQIEIVHAGAQEIIDHMLREQNPISVLNSYYESRHSLATLVPKRIHDRLITRVADAVMEVFAQDNSVRNDLTRIVLHLIKHFDKRNLKAWYALSLLFNETKLTTGYTFLHRVVIATNDEMFDFLNDDCMPMAMMLSVSKTFYSVRFADLIDTCDTGGRTPLAVSIMLLEMCSIKLLLDNGAQPRLVNIAHQGPLAPSAQTTRPIFLKQVLSVLGLHTSWAYKRLLQKNENASHIFDNKIHKQSQRLWTNYTNSSLNYRIGNQTFQRVVLQNLSMALAPRTQYIFDILLTRAPEYAREVDNLGRNILHYAAMDGNMMAINIILDHCDANLSSATDVFSNTASMYAILNGYEKISYLLRSHEKVEYSNNIDPRLFCLAGSEKNNSAAIKFSSSNDFTFRLARRALGEWSRLTIDHIDICEIRQIERTDDRLNQVIYNHFVIRQQPLIIRNCTEMDMNNWKAKDKWTKSKIVESYGSRYSHSVAKIPYSQLYGGRRVEGPFTLEEYINKFLISKGARKETFTLQEPPFYWFKALVPPYDDISKAIINDIEPLAFLHDETRNYTFTQIYYQHFVGAIGSGSSPHLHNNAWNALVYGKKLWFIWKPADSFISNIPTYNYVKGANHSNEKSMQCIQNQGDIILVPQNWGHSTFSLSENVGIASEFTIDL